ncbi:hypothetical protein BSUBE1_3246 [Bacillus subtilis E1]|nr:hypothetical protein BSUBE1_3246 [Bacillus subtilis E1]
MHVPPSIQASPLFYKKKIVYCVFFPYNKNDTRVIFII